MAWAKRVTWSVISNIFLIPPFAGSKDKNLIQSNSSGWVVFMLSIAALSGMCDFLLMHDMPFMT